MSAKSPEAVLSLCHKATVLGNKIAIHMLEYLGTVEKHSAQFDDLAHEFMDTSRIMWSLEAGLAECARAGQKIPAEMATELDKKFRATTTDFQGLDQILSRFLEYEKKGAMGKLQKGLRSMFPSNDVEKMRDNLGKTRDALRMSALVFQWSLGDDKVDESAGIGYTGLAAALDRMAQVKTSSTGHSGGGGSNPPGSREKAADVVHHVHEVLMSPVEQPIASFPAMAGHGSSGVRSVSEQRQQPGSNHSSLRHHPLPQQAQQHQHSQQHPSYQQHHNNPHLAERVEREPSISNFTIKSASSTHSSARERRMSMADNFDRFIINGGAPTTNTMSNNNNPHGGSNYSSNVNVSHSNPHVSNLQHQSTFPTAGSVGSGSHHSHHGMGVGRPPSRNAAAAAISESLADEMDAFEPFGKVVRFQADPASQPRWTPRNTSTAGSGADSHHSLGSSHAVRESLVQAIEARNAKLAEQLLDRGASPNTLVASGSHHVLNLAIGNHDAETVRVLLLFGADANTADGRGVTPLWTAVAASSLEAATMLLKYGADPNLPSSSNHEQDPQETPLAAAVVEDKFTLARALLAYGGDANHCLTEAQGGDALLMAAVRQRRSRRTVDLLLDYGADANAKDGRGHTPLFEAILAGRIEVVASLLDHRANPNLPGPKHMLWPAAALPRVLELLLARGADPRLAPGVMELATSENNLEAVRVLLKAGVDANAKKDGIYTPLCSSIRDDRAEIFELLLSHGADPNLASSEYPTFKCVTHYRTQYLAPLVAAGADLNTPKGILETAVACHNLEALNWLLDSGRVSPNDKAAKTGATPLTTAIRENRPDLVELLLSRGADPNIRGEDWPVCMAVRQPAILKRLLPALAEPRAFKGVVEMAVAAGQLESVKLLLRAGVSVEDRNGGVFSPLTTAIREERKEIVRYLLEEAGADVNAPGEHLPIVKALRRLHQNQQQQPQHPLDTEILELLLRHGADPNKLYRGHNGFFQAVENGSPELLAAVLGRSLFPVDLAARDDAGLTVLEVAASRGWHEGRALLLQAGSAALGPEGSDDDDELVERRSGGSGSGMLRPAPTFSSGSAAASLVGGGSSGNLSRANTSSTTATTGGGVGGPRSSSLALNNVMNSAMR